MEQKMEDVKKEPQCQIESCGKPIPDTNPKDGQGNPLPLCSYHFDILNVVLWGLTHIRQAPQQEPQIIIPGTNVPRDFDPKSN